MEGGKTPGRVAFLSRCQIVWQLNENHPRARNDSLKKLRLSKAPSGLSAFFMVHSTLVLNCKKMW